MNTTANYLVIGSGRVARHVQHYMSLLGIPFSTWTRVKARPSIPPNQNNATHVLLLISDSSIQEFHDTYLKNWQIPIIHFSGALEISGTHGAHPLMTFGPDLYSLEFYKKIPFVTTSALTKDQLLPGFPNPLYPLRSEYKSYYHALCVLGGNLTALLANRMLEGFQEIKIPAGIALPYLQKSLENVFQNSALAFTGPLARKDSLTVQRNLESLRGDAFENVYRAFIPIVFPEFKEIPNENL